MRAFWNLFKTQKIYKHTKGGLRMKKGLSKNRQKELEYFARQYYEWKEELASIPIPKETGEFSDPTGEEAIRRNIYARNIKAVDDALSASCPDYIVEYLLKNVVKGETYELLSTKGNLICGRRQFYEYRSIFFKNLSQKEHMFL